MVADGDEEKFDRLRYVELKHGRISMLAVVGYLVTEAGVRLPGDIDLSGRTFESIPSGFAALSAIQPAGLAQIFFFVGVKDCDGTFLLETHTHTHTQLKSQFRTTQLDAEIFVMRDIVGGEFPGDFRNDFIDFGWDLFDEDTKFVKRSIELNQGRAAMMGM
eukprot:scaffold353_cov185-Amphora_coffeaeformis.AAC.51